ncbi:nucleotidyltransferase family protein [Spirosoma sp. BT702]|uniref:Nucleotidyltransferase family protein n=1 Tax=Spirosoma profusum TaxID=2771354 RepID=A0A926Y2P3_9BACT|nr:nucleotidyltransferase family protein [Spirosoma profusum]MBD2702693.1 nucleotidyltransferase family protein [Spirosoma profusum]
MRIATLILAAGSSSRLGGTPKQLLQSEGKTLLRRITEAALSLEIGPVVIVLGANREQLQSELSDLLVLTSVNEDWQEGIASSLRSGLGLIATESLDGFLVVLTDQPYITTDLLRQLITTYQQSGKGIVACRYGEANHLGVPALFSLKYKADFINLSGDIGARKLIQHYVDDCADVAFPLASVDLDTWEDVAKWQGR